MLHFEKMEALVTLFKILSAIIAAIAFFGSVIILSVKKANIVEAEVHAKDGSTKIKKKDVLYNKCIKISVIAGIVSLICFSVPCVPAAFISARDCYNYYQEEDRLSELQYYIDMADGRAYDNTWLRYTQEARNLSDAIERSLSGWRSWYLTHYFDNEYIKILLLPVILNLLFVLYMYPTKTARIKNHDQTTAITWLNAIFGITVIGWVAMLIWANSPGNYNDDQNKKMNLNQLEKLKSLLDSGVITQEEFEEKRKDLIKNI